MTISIEPYPWFLNKHVEVTVSGREVATRITTTTWQEHWRPLLEKIYDLHQQHPQRLMVAIGGPPGVGKSILTEQLAWVIEKISMRNCHAAALPMDGFHYSATYLHEHERTLENGVKVPLINYKGAPDTFDVPNLKARVALLRTVPREATWPGYSRLSHDVVENEFHVTASVNIILVEGNYMLLDRGPWKGLPGLFDYRIYIDAPAAMVITNLMERHLAGGRPQETAKEWLKRIDLPNARLAESTRKNADLIIERSGDQEIAGLKWQEGGVAAV